MSKKGRFSKWFMVLLACLVMFQIVAINIEASQNDEVENVADQISAAIREAESSNTKAEVFKITSEDELLPYFPDVNFRTAVFKAVNDGKGDAIDNDPSIHRPGCNSDIEDALYNFRGTISHNMLGKGDNQKIKDITGIQYLRNAEKVSLKYNLISDFTSLEMAAEQDKTYYGELLEADNDIDVDGKNVVWDIAGNPIEKLPSTFGGRLKILQPGSSSFTYPENSNQSFIFVRPTKGTTNHGTIRNINKTVISTIDGGTENANLETVFPYYGEPGDSDIGLEITGFTNTTADFTGPTKGGTANLAVGTKEDLKYSTQDEYENITPGEQSHKYYLTYTMKVFDGLVAETFTNGEVELVKKDINGNPIRNAMYGVYAKDDDKEVARKTTDEDGKIVIHGLWGGDYYFKEISAPDGYLLNDEKISFTVTGTHATDSNTPKIIVGGGETSVITMDNQVVNAPTNRFGNEGRLFSGGRDGSGNLLSPDITLIQNASTATPNGVDVTYSKLEVNGKVETNVVRHFEGIDCLAQAAENINKEKSYELLKLINKVPTSFYGTNILGSVSVVAYYNDADDKSQTFSTLDKATQMIDIKGEKVWDDYDNALNLRPDKVTISLLRDGVEYRTTEATVENNWKYEFTNIPKTDMYGKDITSTYTVAEQSVPEGYIPSVNGTIITNTLNEDENLIVTVDVQKKWIGDDASMRPESITVSLFQNDASASYLEAVLDADSDWKYTFDKLPKVDANGKAYVYTIKENDVEGYTLASNVIEKQNDGISYKAVLINEKEQMPPTPPTTNPSTPSTPNPPLTGDHTCILLWLMLAGGSAGCLIWFRKKGMRNLWR